MSNGGGSVYICKEVGELCACDSASVSVYVEVDGRRLNPGDVYVNRGSKSCDVEISSGLNTGGGTGSGGDMLTS